MDKAVYEKLFTTLESQKDLIETSNKNLNDKVEEGFSNFNERVKVIEESYKNAGGTSLPGVEDEKQEFSFFKAVNAIGSGDWSDASFEKEVMFETRKKAQSHGTPSEGGFLVPTQFVAEMIELLRSQVVVAKAGATFLNELQGSPVEIPKQTGASTGVWVDENVSITESQATFGQLTMTPKNLAAFVKLSNRVVRMSNPSIEAMIRADIAAQHARALDLAALRGTGVSSEPLGITQTAGVGDIAIGTNGGDLTFELLADLEGLLEDANALLEGGKFAYIWNPKIRRKLQKTRIAQYSGDTAGDFIITPITSQKNLSEFIGYNFLSTTQLPTNLTKGSSTDASEVIFGNFADLIIASWGRMEIAVSSVAGNSFQTNQTFVRVTQDSDVAVKRPESFGKISDARIN